MIDENTRPFVAQPHQPLFNTTHERDCDDYEYRASRDGDNDDINEIYRTTLRDLDHERDKRWRAEQEIKHLNGLIEDMRKQGASLSQQVEETSMIHGIVLFSE